jgi:hypothetical protein
VDLGEGVGGGELGSELSGRDRADMSRVHGRDDGAAEGVVPSVLSAAISSLQRLVALRARGEQGFMESAGP